MHRRYPPDVRKLLDSLDRARKRLRQEIERTRELLRQIERQTDSLRGPAAPLATSYLRPR